MSKKNTRKEFTNKQKAEIFARDRATCTFSGKSLWALDFGACPLAQWDWVDHIKPSARGGGTDLSNGVCVSHTFNMKKRANGADRFMLTDPEWRGAPSEDHFYYFGAIRDDWHDQLIRLSMVEARDWYFNRAVCHLLHASWLSYRRLGYDRKPRYYRDAALKKLEEYRQLGGTADSLGQRGLVLHPQSEDVILLLSMITTTSKSEFDRKLAQLKKIYAANTRMMDQFWRATTPAGMTAVAKKVAQKPEITPAVREAIESHLKFRKADRC